MTYDCFTFFNELDLLEIRLNILDSVVDKFVLVEATKTFTNNDKPLYFEQNKERFKKFEHKIIHIVVDTYPPFTTAWEYEYHQRNSIARGLTNCADTDTILISDIDEIPNPAVIARYKNYPGVIVFKQLMFYYFLNMINITNPYWADLSTKMLSYANFKKHNSSAQEVRFLRGKLVSNGGWHFSYLGGAEAIALKIKSFAHQELNTSEHTDVQKITERIKNGEDLFYNTTNRNRYAALPMTPNYPNYIFKNQDRYNTLIAPTNLNLIRYTTLMLNSLKWTFILYLKQIKRTLIK